MSKPIAENYLTFIPISIILTLFYIVDVCLGTAAIAVPDTCILNDPTKFSFLPYWTFIGPIIVPFYFIAAYGAHSAIVNYINAPPSLNDRLHAGIYLVLSIFDVLWLIIGFIYFGASVPECFRQTLGDIVISSMVFKFLSFVCTVSLYRIFSP